MPRPLPEPTNASPGSLEKIEVLAFRWREGYEMQHPADKQYQRRAPPVRVHYFDATNFFRKSRFWNPGILHTILEAEE